MSLQRTIVLLLTGGAVDVLVALLVCGDNILLLIALVMMWRKSATRYLTVVPDQSGTV